MPCCGGGLRERMRVKGGPIWGRARYRALGAACTRGADWMQSDR